MTRTIPAQITNFLDWATLRANVEPSTPSEAVTGTLISLWVERDNLYHALIKNDAGVHEVEGYAGFLFAPSPDGVNVKPGEHLDLVLAGHLGGFIRRGWEDLAVERAFAPVSAAWIVRDSASHHDTAIPAGTYAKTSVSDFFSIVFEDEPSFADDDDLA